MSSAPPSRTPAVSQHVSAWNECTVATELRLLLVLTVAIGIDPTKLVV